MNDSGFKKEEVLKRKLSAVYDGASSASLSDLALNLLEQQKSSWPQLAAGYAALALAQQCEIRCHGFSVRLQFNPQRIISSGAKVDEKSIRERRCFLCLENLPEQQFGMLYRNQFIVLCNPAPIFAYHYTISHLDHVPQLIEGNLGILLTLAKDFSPRFTVFYNGPRCGASAPDHLHFQASPTGAIPIENDIADPARRTLIRGDGGVSLFQIENLGRPVFLLEGKRHEAVETRLSACIAALWLSHSPPMEPMMNVICSYRSDYWRVIIFPRRKHRPEAFFREGAERILISPAAVDMGGLIVTPVEKDFLNADAELIESIYEEVSVDKNTLAQIVAALRE
ncbi:MAG: DUF4922 domain-containing protein [candidate division KSB1 bacterium]|nr:DUF4922 domain-containing protein [candidate division KSB1 bacterium]